MTFGLGVCVTLAAFLLLGMVYVVGKEHACIQMQHQATTQGHTEIAAFVKSAEACQ